MSALSDERPTGGLVWGHGADGESNVTAQRGQAARESAPLESVVASPERGCGYRYCFRIAEHIAKRLRLSPSFSRKAC